MAVIDKADRLVELIVEVELLEEIISAYFCLCLDNISVTVTNVFNSGTDLAKDCRSPRLVSHRRCTIERSLAGSPLTRSSSGYGFSRTLCNGKFKKCYKITNK